MALVFCIEGNRFCVQGGDQNFSCESLGLVLHFSKVSAVLKGILRGLFFFFGGGAGKCSSSIFTWKRKGGASVN